jgi:hypothetical protein
MRDPVSHLFRAFEKKGERPRQWSTSQGPNARHGVVAERARDERVDRLSGEAHDTSLRHARDRSMDNVPDVIDSRDVDPLR